MNNPPMLIRTIAEYRWQDGIQYLLAENLEQVRVETHGIWEFTLIRDPTNMSFVLCNTYRNNILVSSYRELLRPQP